MFRQLSAKSKETENLKVTLVEKLKTKEYTKLKEKVESKTLCDDPVVSFTSQEIENFHTEWASGGERDFFSKIILRQVWTGPIEIIDDVEAWKKL